MAGSDRIKVFLRVRPLTADEQSETECFSWNDRRILPLVGKEAARSKEGYLFQRVISPGGCNAAVFDEVKDVVSAAFEGINGTLLAYGHTSAGKTHTMLGTEQDIGLMGRATQHIFQTIESQKKSSSMAQHEVSISYFEVYMEKVFDLLATERKELDVVSDADGAVIPGLSVHAVGTVEDCLSAVQLGQENRSKARTNLNEHSSRSHTILQIDLVQYLLGRKKTAQIRLVDLAGSENAKLAGTTGDALREGGSINKSLLALTNVIHSLAQKASHVPYRDAKLTRILMSSLGGNSRTSIIGCIAPAKKFFEDTLCTLHFAERARVVFNCVKVNETDGARMVPFEVAQELAQISAGDMEIACAREQALQAAILTHTSAALDIARAEAEADCELFTTMLYELELKLNDVEKERKEAVTRMEAAEMRFACENAKWKQQHKELTAEIMQAKEEAKQVVQLKKTLASKTEQVQELQRKMKELKEKASDRSEVDILTTEVERLKGQLAKIQAEKEVTSAQCIALQTKLSTATSGQSSSTASKVDSKAVDSFTERVENLKKLYQQATEGLDEEHDAFRVGPDPTFVSKPAKPIPSLRPLCETMTEKMPQTARHPLANASQKRILALNVANVLKPSKPASGGKKSPTTPVTPKTARHTPSRAATPTSAHSKRPATPTSTTKTRLFATTDRQPAKRRKKQTAA